MEFFEHAKVRDSEGTLHIAHSAKRTGQQTIVVVSRSEVGILVSTQLCACSFTGPGA